MTDKKKPDDLEMENIKLERFKLRGKIIIATITVLFGSGLGTYINYSIQSRQLKQQELINKSKIKQSEMENLGKFLKHALEDDINKRIRFADYFTKLTISKDVQSRWKGYYSGLEALKDKKEQLKTDRKTADKKEKERIDTELARVIEQTAPLLTGAERFKANMVPESDTDNKFELKEIEQKLINGKKRVDKVVIDHETGLMWQQSGSVKMKYQKAEEYIANLNTNKFAGYNVWRLPTVFEAITLLETEKYISDVYADYNLFINDVFDKNQDWIWTSDRDKEHDSRAFAVKLSYRTYCSYNMMDKYNVRAVLFEKNLNIW